MESTANQGVARRGRKRKQVKRVLAWGVHLYTALGLVAAAGMAVCIVHGTVRDFRIAFLLMFVATVIDATDGTLARGIRIKEVLPGFDGRRLDDIVDFLTYTALPLFLIWKAHLLPAGYEAVLLLPLLASAYGFCQVSAKTEDGYFLGFPSYWNLVAFYLYVLQPLSQWVALALVVILALLTFVPSRYLYPTHHRTRLNRWTNLLAASWAVLLAWLLWHLLHAPDDEQVLADNPTRRLALASLYFPIYYMVASWFISLRFWRRRLRRLRETVQPAMSP
jgi:phosphatidylcholine synthase